MNNTKIIGQAVAGERVIYTHDYSKPQPEKDHAWQWMEPHEADELVRIAADSEAEARIAPGSDAGSLMLVTFESGLIERFEASRH